MPQYWIEHLGTCMVKQAEVSLGMAISGQGGQRLELLGPLCDQPAATRPPQLQPSTSHPPHQTRAILKRSTTTNHNHHHSSAPTTGVESTRILRNPPARILPQPTPSLAADPATLHPHPPRPRPRPTPTALADDVQPARTTTPQPSLRGRRICNTLRTHSRDLESLENPLRARIATSHFRIALPHLSSEPPRALTSDSRIATSTPQSYGLLPRLCPRRGRQLPHTRPPPGPLRYLVSRFTLRLHSPAASRPPLTLRREQLCAAE